MFKRVGLSNVQSKEKLNEDLQKFQNELPKSVHLNRISKVMVSHYEEIKKETGVDKLFEPDPPDKISNDAFAKLRPMTPYSLQQLLDPAASQTLLKKYLFNDIRIRAKKPQIVSISNTLKPHSLHRQTASLSTLPSNSKPWVYKSKVNQSPPQLIRHRSRLSFNLQS